MGDVKTGTPSTNVQSSNSRYSTSLLFANSPSPVRGSYLPPSPYEQQHSPMSNRGVPSPAYVDTQARSPNPNAQPAPAAQGNAAPTDGEIVAQLLQGILKGKSVVAEVKTLGQTLSQILSTPLRGTLESQKQLVGCASNIGNLTHLTACDADVYQLMVAMARDAAAMQVIASNANKQMRHALIDAVYPQITDIKIAEIAFFGRFEIQLGSARSLIIRYNLQQAGKTEIPWTIEGAKQIYDILLKLPPSRVSQLKVFTTSNLTDGNSGFANADDGHVHLELGDKNAVEDGLYTTSKSDRMRGLNLNNTTTLHEIAHVLDKNQQYSKRPAFRKFSDWNEYPRSDMNRIINIITENSPKPYPSDAKTGEKAFIDMALVYVFRDGVEKAGGRVVEPVNKTIVAETKNHFSHPDTDSQSKTRLETKLKRSDAYNRFLNAHAVAEPWFGQEAESSYRVAKGVHIHEGYEGYAWYSYNHAARKSKYSGYQFRTPGEEFAEVFATYHATNGKGVDPARRAWFEANGLHSDDPLCRADKSMETAKPKTPKKP
ncbi:MAG: hypothetical protein FWC40_00655 [Proteobacteria bacterium]|nr:hypothetical protein [Pseudomonadota bacterium]